MKQVLANQFSQFYRIFTNVVQDFDDESWQESGHKLTSPKLLSFHILQSIKYYSKDKSDFITHDHRVLKSEYKIVENFTMSQNEVLENIEQQRLIINNWIDNIELETENVDFKWTGVNTLSVVVFLAQHSFYHLGELNCLLNESLKGNARDHFAVNIY